MSDQVTAGQVVAAIEAGEVVAPVRESVAINRLAARKVKVYNPATGEVTRQADTADVMTALLAAEKLRADEREVVDRQKAEAAWAAVRERRAKGLPDLCGECGDALSMAPKATYRRSTKPWPAFNCVRCAAKKSLTPERRSEMGRVGGHKAYAALTPVQRIEMARKGGRKAQAALTPEQQQERGRKLASASRAKKHQEST